MYFVLKDDNNCVGIIFIIEVIMLFLINGFCNIVDIFKLIFESCFMFELFIEKVLESVFIVVCELLFLKIG